jgi:hypothetical protein
MKSIFTLVLFFNLITITTFGQGWLDIGLKGGFGPTLLMNKNIFNDQKYNHQIGVKGNFGGKIGLNFNSNHQITVDVIMSSFEQKFKYSESIDTASIGETNYESAIRYKALDILVMYRHNEDGRYFEIGPAISNTLSASRSDNKLPGGTDNAFTKDAVNPLQVGFTVGFGAYFMGTDNFGITSGLRVTYMATDLISNNGINLNYPTGKSYSSYAASHPLLIQIVFEANLDFAYMARANCGKRKLLMF